MQFTFYRLAESVLKKLGVKNGRTALKPNEVEDVLLGFVSLLDFLNTESLMVPFITRIEFDNISSSKRLYTVGPEGDLQMTVPIEVLAAEWIDEGGANYPIDLISMNNYINGEGNKNTSIGRPTRIFYNASYPNAELRTDIFPLDSDKLALWVKLPLEISQLTSLGVSCPTGDCYANNCNSCSCGCSSDASCCGVDDFSYSVSAPETLQPPSYAAIITQAKAQLESLYGDCIPCNCTHTLTIEYSGGSNGTIECTVTATKKAVTTFSPISIDEFITFPPGYYNMLLWNLAEFMAPEYDMEPTPTMQRQAYLSRKNLKSRNNKTPELSVDRGLTSRSQYNITSGPGTYRR